MSVIVAYNPPPTVTTNVAAKRLGVKQEVVAAMARAGILSGVRWSGRGRWRVLEESVDKLAVIRRTNRAKARKA